MPGLLQIRSTIGVDGGGYLIDFAEYHRQGQALRVLLDNSAPSTLAGTR
jgi:hypothetical protein